MNEKPITEIPITNSEKEIVADAMIDYDVLRSSEILRSPEIRYMAAAWYVMTTPLAERSGWSSPEHWRAQRLIATYLAVYPHLEEAGRADGFGGSESKSRLLTLAFNFAPDEQTGWVYAREAMDVDWDAPPTSSES